MDLVKEVYSKDCRIARIEGILEQVDKRITEFRKDFNTRLLA